MFVSILVGVVFKRKLKFIIFGSEKFTNPWKKFHSIRVSEASRQTPRPGRSRPGQFRKRRKTQIRKFQNNSNIEGNIVCADLKQS
jgi:hypothetical protein